MRKRGLVDLARAAARSRGCARSASACRRPGPTAAARCASGTAPARRRARRARCARAVRSARAAPAVPRCSATAPAARSARPRRPRSGTRAFAVAVDRRTECIAQERDVAVERSRASSRARPSGARATPDSARPSAAVQGQDAFVAVHARYCAECGQRRYASAGIGCSSSIARVRASSRSSASSRLHRRGAALVLAELAGHLDVPRPAARRQLSRLRAPRVASRAGPTASSARSARTARANGDSVRPSRPCRR